MASGNLLERVGKLLAQAEATTGPEAEAFAERAQHIANQYQIDLELARYSQTRKEEREEPTTERVVIGEPGRQFKNRWWVDLMWRITDVNDVRWTVSGDRSVMWLYGYPSDIEVCKLMFASLNAQMVGGVARDMKNGVHKQLGVHGATYRLNYYEGFIQTIGSRLYRARREAMDEQRKRDDEIAARLADAQPAVATEQDVVLTGALVMVKKKKAVDDYYEQTHNAPRDNRRRAGYQSIVPKTRSRAARAQGEDAGNRARLQANAGLPGPRKAVSGG